MAKTKKHTASQEVKVSYDVLVRYMSKMNKVFEQHNITWEKTECIASSKSGNPTEWSGILTGSYKNVFKFIKSAFGKVTAKEFETDYIQK